jgi:adenylate cyclase
MRAQRILAYAVALLAAVAGGLLVRQEEVAHLVGADELELWTLDVRQRTAAGSRKAGAEGARSSDVVLVLFDEASVEEWTYESPFPRPVIADLVTALAGAGARTIGLDVYLERLYPELNAREGGDDLLHEAIRRAGNVVLAAPVREGEGKGRSPVLARPAPYFAQEAADVGAAELPTPFETVRDGVLAVRSGGGLEPSWALALYAHARGLDPDSLLSRSLREGEILLPGLPERWGEIPPGWRGEGPGPGFAMPFPIRFVGPPSRTAAENPAAGTFSAYSSSYVPVLAAFSPEFFRDKIVLVGSGFHDQDKFRTPFYDATVPAGEEEAGERKSYGWMYGVEVHANALQNMLDGEYIRPLGSGWLALLILALTAPVAGLTFRRGALLGAAGAALGVLSITALALWAYLGEVFLPVVGTVVEMDEPFLWIPVVSPALAVVLAYVGSTAYVSVVEGREKRFIRSAFGKYVSPAVVARIAETPEALRLGGRKCPLTVLFADLAGFTTLSEELEPEELVARLNEYLTEMTDIVLEEGGTLDKYIGDAIMAFWNAPQQQEDHARRALRCAIRMQRKMKELNRRWSSREGPGRELTVRIGINTGTAVVGNVGGRARFDYSAIGDPVNLAARLEPANKTYGTLVMASEFTLAETSGDCHTRELDLLAVKGRSEPVRVFEILEMGTEELSAEKREALSQYRSGLAAFQRRDWELAAKYFRAALEADPDDGPSRVYLDRSHDFIANPPPAEWDFVVRRNVK